MLSVRLRPALYRAVKLNRLRWQHRHVRSFASSSAASIGTSSTAKSPFLVFGSLVNELDRLAPRIELQPDQIEILKSPEQFYEALKVGMVVLLIFQLTRL